VPWSARPRHVEDAEQALRGGDAARIEVCTLVSGAAKE
jgi:hypothetical protein